MTVTSPVIRYHGGKFRLAPWVMKHFPPHRIYVEPFGGAAGVLIRKPRAYSEVYNDLDGEVCNLFRVLQDAGLREQLVQQLVFTPYARAEFEQAWVPAQDPVERARRLIVRAQMGFGSAGATCTTGFRKKNYKVAQNAWANFPDKLAAVGLRLSGVMIENRPAVEVIADHDTPETLIYVDPPYVHETRYRINDEGSARVYRHEMDTAEHLALLDALRAARGMVVLSGYPHPLYDDALAGWERHTTKARISAGRGTATRDEVLWINPACRAALAGGGLFSTLQEVA